MSAELNGSRPRAERSSGDRAALAQRILVALASAWCLAVLLAPLLTRSTPVVSDGIYSAFAFICHQRPERSFHLPAAWPLLEHQLAACHRCAGLYLGMLTGLLLWPLPALVRLARRFENEPRLLLLAVVPLLIDVLAAPWNTAATRFVTGFLASLPIALLLLRGGAQLLESVSARSLGEENA